MNERITYDAAIEEAAQRMAPSARKVNSRGAESTYIELLDDITHEYAVTVLGLEVGTPAFEKFALDLDAHIAKLTGFVVSVDAEDVQQIERTAKSLRVPMTHVARDDEYLSVLEYRIEQELTKAEQRIAALRNLKARVVRARAEVQS